MSLDFPNLLNNINILYQRKNNMNNLLKLLHEKNDNILNCNEKFIKFIDDGNISQLKNCYNIHDPIISDIYQENPLKINDKCRLINTKKSKYYIHTYDPQKIIENIKLCGADSKIIDDYIKNINEICYTKKKTNCCNCISIVYYYYNGRSDRNIKYYDYLRSIRRSIKNVKQMLPNWIVRIYLDTTVYNLFSGNDNETNKYKNIFDEIINNDIVELYTYVCENIINDSVSIHKTRTYRFLPLADEDVSICIIREADGIVTNLDCHNIKIFENSNKIFYILPMNHSIENIWYHNNLKHGSYTGWLNYYKNVLEKSHFESHQNFYELLAGIFGIKLILKKSYYSNILINLNSIMNKLDEKVISEYRLNIGFDEIFLLSLYKKIATFPFNIKSRRERTYSANNGYKDQEYVVFGDNYTKLFKTIFIADGFNILETDISYVSYYTIIAQIYNNIKRLHDVNNPILLLLYVVDALTNYDIIDNKNVSDQALNITMPGYKGNITMFHLVNTPYPESDEKKLDEYYDNRNNFISI